ncbi:MAG TPA: response regulator [Polyangiaceae bacterium]|nr:response regulator [Polyangiaceae bacterium]
MSRTPRVLHVEDDSGDAEIVLRELRRGGLEVDVVRVHDEPSFREALSVAPDLVISDYALPGFDGLSALRLLKARHPEVPFILVSGAIGEDLAVAAMREGAADYLLKDRLSRLPTAVRSVLAQVELRRENRQLEERLLRASRLESLGRLAAGLAHDMNNILLPIMMAEQVLREHVTHPDAQELLQAIETSTQRGARVLKQLLTFGRGTGGQRVSLRPERSIAEIHAVLRETFPKNIAIETRLVHADGVVLADPTQLQQILLNLCVNARDAMPGGGKLVLTLERAELSPEQARNNPGSTPGPHVVLSVRDDGTGIAPADLEKIFDPFFTTKSLAQGTGLGLSSVLGIVQSYGGFVQVESALGKGTEFRVWLREHLGDAIEEPHAASQGRPSGRGQLVLVVDDEATVRDVLGATITRFGYRVLPMADGWSALRQLDERATEVAVVVADVAMPKLDGLELAREIRKRRGDLPLIIMTAALTPEKRAGFAGLGVVDFLIKPFQTEALLRSLDHALSPGRSPASAARSP